MIRIVQFFFTGLLIVMSSFTSVIVSDNSSSNGAWKNQEGTIEQILLLSDGYFMHTIYDSQNKQFLQSRGGTYEVSNKNLSVKIEFDTKDKEQIGQSFKYAFNKSNTKLSSDIGGKKASWTMLDKGEGEISGTWRMSGRKQDGKITYSPPRARKTLKVLTGTRFQWAAINAETKEFFGTGGGTYTFENGKYTEKIEFFSRDNSRVGATLAFDGKLIDGNWHHSGLSSTGNPIYEVWSRDSSK